MSSNEDSPIRLVSELPEPRDRFLARVVDQVLQDGFRSAEDFLRHFPPAELVASLADAEELRVKLLTSTTGMHEKIARKKSLTSAAEDLDLALEEGTTSAAMVVDLYPPDDRVRHLDGRKLWKLATEDAFWTVSASEDRAAHSRAAARLTFLVECALSEGLLSLRDIADGLTFHEIATSLPVLELQEVVKHALQIARAEAPLSEERLLAVVPLPSLLELIPLDHTWERVVLAKIAVPQALVESTDPPAAASPAPPAAPAPPAPSVPPPPVAAKPESAPPAAPETDSAPKADSTGPAAPKAHSAPPERAPAPSPSPPPAPPERPRADSDIEIVTEGFDSAPSAAEAPAPPPPTPSTAPQPPPAPPKQSSRPPEEDTARRRVIERLQVIQRLPPAHDDLSTPILLSIESMYADLSTLMEDEERENCIHESFPNQSHLRTAMLALIELLDPSVDTRDPVIRDADVDGLIKIVLFEERRRQDAPVASRPAAAPPPTSVRRARRSMPPPLPGTPSAPPVQPASRPPPLPEQPVARRKS